MTDAVHNLVESGGSFSVLFDAKIEMNSPSGVSRGMGETQVRLPLGGRASTNGQEVREPRLRLGTLRLVAGQPAPHCRSVYGHQRETPPSRQLAKRRRLVGLLTLLFTVLVSSFGIAPILKGKISALDTVGLGIFVFIMLGGSFNFWLYAIGFVLDHRSERRKKGIQTAEYADQGNPKSEYRNPKQIQNGKKEGTGKRNALPVWLLCFFHFFRIVSDFGFRISKLLRIRVHPCSSVVSAPVSSVNSASSCEPSPLIPLPSDGRGEVRTRTAIVMPIYNEDTERVYLGIRQTWLSVRKAGLETCCDFYVLSDSTDEAIREQETVVLERLREEFCEVQSAEWRVQSAESQVPSSEFKVQSLAAPESDVKRVGPTIDNLAGLLAGIVRA